MNRSRSHEKIKLWNWSQSWKPRAPELESEPCLWKGFRCRSCV